ncbi:MAG: hypothetical protein MJ211_06225 [Bacteroidales bacterium]|nr:hypothetical protein [Bacteroidales bacterium]
MKEMWNGFLLGFGGTLGVIIAILSIIILIFIIIEIKNHNIGKKDLPRLLLLYRKTLVKQDKFEELSLINKYIKELKENKLPKELAQKYKVVVKRHIHEEYTNSGSNYMIKYDKKLIYIPQNNKENKTINKTNIENNNKNSNSNNQDHNE